MIANIENNDGERALLVDIETLRESERKAKEASAYTEAVIESIPPFLVLDSKLRVQTANESFCEHFHVSRPQTENWMSCRQSVRGNSGFNSERGVHLIFKQGGRGRLVKQNMSNN